MSRIIRVDGEVQAALDRIRRTHGFRNYSDAIRYAITARRIQDWRTGQRRHW